ncbi:hypothetical protein [Nannocystis pusilla]
MPWPMHFGAQNEPWILPLVLVESTQAALPSQSTLLATLQLS